MLSLALTGCLTTACTSRAAPVVYSLERFETATYHAQSFEIAAAQSCEAARRALLSHGYLVHRPSVEVVEGRKSFQPSADTHVEIEFHVVCASEGPDRSRIFVSALQDQYAVSRTSGSASLGVAPFGSVSLPIRSSTGSLVKTAGATVQAADFYQRFFALVEHELAQRETDLAQDPPRAILPAPETLLRPAGDVLPEQTEQPTQLESLELVPGAVSYPVR